MATEEEQDLVYFNGINGETGKPHAPMSCEDMALRILGEPPPPDLDALAARLRDCKGEHYGLKAGLDSRDLAQAGWGVIFSRETDPALRQALSPLLNLRHEQAGPNFRSFSGEQAPHPDESKLDFLARHGVGPGPVDPNKVPYYLLIVASPEQISYSFQCQLDVQHAVGRIYFECLEDYANYARSVVTVETGKVRLPRRLSLFAPDYDPQTARSAKHLVRPLLSELTESRPDWQITSHQGDQADKAQLARLLGGPETPALLFTASHGEFLEFGRPDQYRDMGAIHCQDGNEHSLLDIRRGKLRNYYFAGADLNEDSRLLGMLCFQFGCYTAGTPQYDEFGTYDATFKNAKNEAFDRRPSGPVALAKKPFVASLPMGMLAHPGGGALAVIGHVDRAWTFSFSWPKAGPQTTVFESTLTALLDGYPVGAALEYFNLRYAELATELTRRLDLIDMGKRYDARELVRLWAMHHDARGYVIVGDPAVRLSLSDKGTPDQERVLARAAARPVSPPEKQSKPTPEPEPEYEEFSFSDNLKTTLTQQPEDVVEVRTYTVEGGLEQACQAKAMVPGESAQLRILTRLDGAGNVTNLVDAAEMDPNLMAIHRETLAWTREKSTLDKPGQSGD